MHRNTARRLEAVALPERAIGAAWDADRGVFRLHRRPILSAGPKGFVAMGLPGLADQLPPRRSGFEVRAAERRRRPSDGGSVPHLALICAGLAVIVAAIALGIR